ncbi:MAG: hypothetical protein WCQ77_09075 [Planctomycetota bacterium]
MILTRSTRAGIGLVTGLLGFITGCLRSAADLTLAAATTPTTAASPPPPSGGVFRVAITVARWFIPLATSDFDIRLTRLATPLSCRTGRARFVRGSMFLAAARPALFSLVILTRPARHRSIRAFAAASTAPTTAAASAPPPPAVTLAAFVIAGGPRPAVGGSRRIAALAGCFETLIGGPDWTVALCIVSGVVSGVVSTLGPGLLPPRRWHLFRGRSAGSK